MTKRKVYVSAAFIAVLAALGCTQAMLDKQAGGGETVQAPVFEVDPLGPKPLPNEWLLGMTIGVSVDAQDNIWIVHRGSSTLNNNEKGAELVPPVAACCKSAPPVLAFNQSGDTIRSWGGPGDGY